MKKFYVILLALVTFASAGYSQTAHWPLDQDTRDVVGVNHGTPSLNGVSFVNDPSRGDVMLLDGVEGIVTLPSNLFSGMDNATITCWFNFSGGAPWQRVWSFGHIEDPWAMFYFSPRDGWEGNHMHVTILGLGRNWRDWNPVAIDTMVWHFAAAVFDADTFKFFLNDTMVIRNDSVPATPNEVMSDPNEAYLGRSHWPDATFNGMIDDVRIYDHALSDAEVLDLFTSTGGVAVPTSRLEPEVFMWGHDRTIHYSGLDEYSVNRVRVYSISGQLLFQSEIMSELRQRKFQPGLYIVHVEDHLGPVSKKVMIPE